MPSKTLTPTLVDRLNAPCELSDSREPGLRLRVTPNGVKSFRWAVRESEKLRWVTLGRFTVAPLPGFLTVDQAREWLRRLKAAHHAGELARVEGELAAHLRPGDQRLNPVGRTVDDVAREFWKVLDVRRKRKSVEALRTYDRFVKDQIGGVALSELRKSHCVALFQNATKQRAKVIGLTKQLLGHAELMDDDFVNPAARFRASDFGVVSRRRKRWLTAEEIAAFWSALNVETRGGPRDETRRERLKMSTALRLLLLTALRSSELRLAEWSDVDLEARTLTVPVKNQKLTPKQAEQAQPFVVPLSPTAIEVLKGLRAIEHGSRRWVIPGESGAYAEKTFGRFMKRLWRGEPGRGWKPHPALAGLDPATPHDLRRTARTWLGKLGVEPHVAERCLNHSLGRIVQTYDLHDYLAERRAALERWDLELQTFTRSSPRNTTRGSTP